MQVKCFGHTKHRVGAKDAVPSIWQEHLYRFWALTGKERKACSQELPPHGVSLLEHWPGWKWHLGVLIALNDYRWLLSVQPGLQECESCFLTEKESPCHSSHHAQWHLHEGTMTTPWETNCWRLHEATCNAPNTDFGGKVLQNCTSHCQPPKTGPPSAHRGWDSPSTGCACRAPITHSTALCKVQAGSTELAMDSAGISESKQH